MLKVGKTVYITGGEFKGSFAKIYKVHKRLAWTLDIEGNVIQMTDCLRIFSIELTIYDIKKGTISIETVPRNLSTFKRSFLTK